METWFLYCSTLLCPNKCLFANCRSYIMLFMVLPLSSFESCFFHYYWGHVIASMWKSYELFHSSWINCRCASVLRAILQGLYKPFLGWPDLQKPNTIAHFSNYSLINNCNQLSQKYTLAKFQPDMPLTVKAMPYKSAIAKRSIRTVSIEKINYRRLQKW